MLDFLLGLIFRFLIILSIKINFCLAKITGNLLKNKKIQESICLTKIINWIANLTWHILF
jgi:hypothetical protein